MFAAFNSFMTGGFSPLSLAPALWLSDTGSDVATWPDLSGNGRHATQATTGNQPAIITSALNGRQGRRFDGGDFLSAGDVLDLRTTSMTIFAVAKFSTSGNGAIVGKSIAAAGAGRYSILRSSGDGGLIGFFSNASTTYSASSADTSTAVRVITSRIDRAAGSLAVTVDGAAFASVGITTESVDLDTSTRLLIGAYSNATDTGVLFHLTGDIYEIIIFPTALTTVNRQQVERYLGARWGIAVA